MGDKSPRLVSACLLLLFWGGAAAQTPGPSGTVLDEAGAPIAGALLTLQSPQGAVLREGASGADGRFTLSGVPAGSYVLEVAAGDFQPRQVSVMVAPGAVTELRVVLSAAGLRDEVTVTAGRGLAAEVATTAQVVTIKDEDDFRARPLVTLGNALEGSPGVMVQQSTEAQVSPFLRGLTGYQVLNLIDGVRFNNSTFRSGPNQYLAFIEPSQAARVEAMLGPSGAQYGSDSLGGTIQVLTQAPQFGRGRLAVHGDLRAFAASADLAGGGGARLMLAGERIAWLVGGSWRRHQDLRAGGGDDSRHVFRRFFGLGGEQIRDLTGSRLQDTGFAQSGWQTKLAARVGADQNLTLWYQGGDQARVRGYKDLWGGLGRLQSEFEPQGLHFLYARYEKLGLGPLDSLAGTFSLNSQSDGSLRQGLRAVDTITTDESLVNAFGYAAQAATHIGRRQALVFGGEVYDERIDATRFEESPVTGARVEKRALYPDGSRYTTYGLYAQHAADLLPGRLRSVIVGRFTRISFRTFADRNRDTAGANLGVVDAAQSYQDVTFNASLSWQASGWLAFHVLVGRGFRAPNLNDLGALGLNDLGYEVPAEAAAAAGGLIGASDGEGVLSTGREVGRLEAERLFNYEFGATLRGRRFYARAQIFDAELRDPIVRRTLLFPAGEAPAELAGVAVTPIAPTTAQRAQGVVSVATGLDPRAVKAFVNDGRARYYGVEALARYAFTPRWEVEGAYSFLVGRELDPNRFVRRLPPQHGLAALRYQPGGRLPWVELSGLFAGAQERLSGGDLTDERIGAARRRRDITDFFQGSLVRPFLAADGTFAPTGETVAQIRDRVLPLGAEINGVRVLNDETRVPLYLSTAGYFALNLRGGLRLGEQVSLNFAVMNLLDKNYRVHGSGVDAPGVNVFVGLRYSF